MTTRIAAAIKQGHTHTIKKIKPFTFNTQIPCNPKSKFQNSTFYKQGDLTQAFIFLSNAITQHVTPTQHEYASVIELCAVKKAVLQGRQIHGHIAKSKCFMTDGFLATKLVFMYGKCGFVKDTHQVFDELPDRTVFSWNALIGAYVNNKGDIRDGFTLYHQMRVKEFVPDACTFALLLKPCGGLRNSKIGRAVHGLVIKYGLQTNTLVANSLIGMYSKCGCFDRAFELFTQLGRQKDIISWNSIVSGSVQNGRFIYALSLFHEMQKHGVVYDSYTIVGILQACAELSLLKSGREIHAMRIKSSQLFYIHEGNALVALYCKCGKIDYANKVFSLLHKKDIISYNSMLSGYVQNGYYTKAIELLHRMIKLGIPLDEVSLITAASAAGELFNIKNGSEIHAYALKKGFDHSVEVGNALIEMYTKCGEINYAKAVFDGMHIRDRISWTSIIASQAQIEGQFGYFNAIHLFKNAQNNNNNRIKVDGIMISSLLQACSSIAGVSNLCLVSELHGYAIRNDLLDLVLKNNFIDIYRRFGKIERSVNIFNGIENKDVVTWTSMINCFTENGLFNEAIKLFSEMVREGIDPDEVGIVSVLTAVSEMSHLNKGKEIHGFVIRRNFDYNVDISTSLLNMYSNCGCMYYCSTIFGLRKSDNLVLYTAMIKALGIHGKANHALKLFDEMLKRKISPDHVAFLAVLHACSHSRLVHEGRFYFGMMVREYGLKPWPEHCTCIVDLLSRAGEITEAYDFVRSMPVKPMAAVWRALLGACWMHGEERIARAAMAGLAGLEPGKPGNYVTVCNVFASRGNWGYVEEIRDRMREKGLRKVPGCSRN